MAVETGIHHQFHAVSSFIICLPDIKSVKLVTFAFWGEGLVKTRLETRKAQQDGKLSLWVPFAPAPLCEDVEVMMASTLLEKAEQVSHRNPWGKVSTNPTERQRTKLRKRMQSVPSIGPSASMVEWLLGQLYPATSERPRPSPQKYSQCADPAANIQQKPPWPELKSAQPGSDRSMNWQREIHKSHPCQHRMSSAGKTAPAIWKLLLLFC